MENSSDKKESNNDNEEQRLRDKVMQRRKVRQKYGDNTMTEIPPAAAATTTTTTPQQPHTVSSATTTTKRPPQGSGSQQGSLPVSSSQSRSTTTHHQSPEAGAHDDQHPHDATNDQSMDSGGSKGQGDSLGSSVSPPAEYNEYSGKSRKRERRRQHRQMNRDAEAQGFSSSQGEGSGSGPSRGSREDRSREDRGQPYPPPRQYHDYPPPGRWQRDRGGGGGDRNSHGSGSSRDHRGGPPQPRRYYEDDYPPRGGPPPPRGDRRYDYGGRSQEGRYRRRSTSRSRSLHSGNSRDDRSRSCSEDRRDRMTLRDRSREESGRGSRERRSNDGSGRRKRSRGDYHDRDSGRHHKRVRRSRRYRDSYNSFSYHSDDISSSSSHSSSSSSSSSSSDDSMEGGRADGEKRKRNEAESAFSKDQRTVFVTQLVMRANEKDIRRYFKKKVGCKVNEVILLRDRRTRSHKGCAYVQFGRIEDVTSAVGVSGQAPDFQRFPILVKASEAEKNYSIPASASVVTASMMGTQLTFAPFTDKDGNPVESQKVYVGGLDPSVSEEHLFAIFSQFGQLEKVSMQMDPVTNARRGYAFLSFRDPKDANLAIQSMAGQVLAGRPMKTGWANQAPSIPGVPIVTSDEFPVDSSARAQKALRVLGQLVGGPSEASVSAQALSATAEKAINAAMGSGNMPTVDPSALGTASPSTLAQNTSTVPTVAQARESMQASVDSQTAAVASTASLAPVPSRHILVHNMYDKDEETEPGWQNDLKEEFTDEASKFGTIEKVIVMHQEPGGKVYVSFEKPEGAKACAENLAGRWFDKRQLRVDFIKDDELPTISPEES